MRLSIWSLPLLSGAILIAIWYAAIAVFDIPHYTLPTPGAILGAIVEKRHLLFPALAQTGWAALLGFLLALFGGFTIAVILAGSKILKRALYPWVLTLQMVPVIVLIPIFVIWFGPGLPSIMAITFMISFFPIVANTTLGLVSTDQGLLDLFDTYGATKWQEIAKLRLPYALPHFLTGVKIAATLAPIGAITGDLLAGTSAGTSGLGYLLLQFRAGFYPPGIYAIAFLSALLGFAFVATVQLIYWLLLHRWHESSNRNQ
ncbi:ABC transporter permease [Rubellicoccus peritrichatus]|uniref:ABC transporter permease n=1 Tax=Rubellicoccus peritrichatus TaxID=3080537 RepID=A0AAQ3LAL7_9BACT|nr:ABC transporter permease [Puniceicoccus sp. CR14]WOO41951.1 ABC transporter permease [Puniceicoccus sp. CR14]